MGQWSYIEREIWKNNSVYRKKEIILDEVYSSQVNQVNWSNYGLPMVNPKVLQVYRAKINLPAEEKLSLKSFPPYFFESVSSVPIWVR